MPSPRVTIDALPEKVTPAGTEFLVIQDGATTKKTLVSAIASSGDYVEGGHGIDVIVALSQAAYDALGVKSPTTLYVINS